MALSVESNGLALSKKLAGQRERVEAVKGSLTYLDPPPESGKCLRLAAMPVRVDKTGNRKRNSNTLLEREKEGRRRE